MSSPDAPCPVELERSTAALRMECRAVGTVLGQLRGDVLSRPTRFGDGDLQQLIAHLVRVLDRIPAVLEEPDPQTPTTDWLGYWSAGRSSSAAPAAEEARRFAQAVNGRRIPDVWEERWQHAHARASVTAPERIVTSPAGTIRLDHYLATRVFELTVGGLDLRAAVELEEVATPLALGITVELLEGLLDGPRPAGLDDDVTFVLAATGRRDHDAAGLPLIR